jgi:carbonic anhydrase
MSAINEMLQANAGYAEGFDHGDLPSPPSRRVAVVSCMDARLIPARFLGLEEGDAHVIANAGGRAQDALRSLVVSQRLLGTNEVVLVQHTDCGMGKYTDADIRAKVENDLGADPGDMPFLTFADVEESVREDLRLLRESPLIGPDVTVRGFVYDVKTGRLAEVAA